jgi:hypothetical protein
MVSHRLKCGGCRSCIPSIARRDDDDPTKSPASGLVLFQAAGVADILRSSRAGRKHVASWVIVAEGGLGDKFGGRKKKA